MSRLTVVVENSVGFASRLLGEHGLSMWVEHQGVNILYDTGMGQALLANLAVLELDPDNLDAVVISHGHYDHMGGLEALLQARSKAVDVWCHPNVFGCHLAQLLPTDPMREIGPPLAQSGYEALGARFHFVEKPVEPWPGITLLAPIPRQTSFEGPMANLVTKQDGKIVPDPLPDDLALLIDAPGGPVCLTGCAHAGAINVLLAAEETAGRPVVLLAGGTHLGPAPAEQQAAALAELAARSELMVAAGHCTGLSMAGRMQSELGSRFSNLSAGLTLEL
ncbi:MAG: MBL fold metallo-hydrolase [Desulfarculaceae bacterium]|nr:MBL fold metallo-hydrolase [Desulfarculaceae bacterium]MCF8074105.1 MBL fold metallo-hydrolase [Desulfarculaceae bacterium]MCF8103772.1 MBL fold metallo-hydrolase [Desulfarculaceae bacterium]MCF8116839.1 MBL fold metallo-hydrolase [Desulfarculaceae bacterium]